MSLLFAADFDESSSSGGVLSTLNDSNGSATGSGPAGMRRVASCPDHKALDTMPDPVTEVCDLQVGFTLVLSYCTDA